MPKSFDRKALTFSGISRTKKLMWSFDFLFLGKISFLAFEDLGLMCTNNFIVDFHKMVTFETDELDQNFTFCCLIKRFIKIALTQNECACSLILIIGLSHHPEAKLFPSHESSFQNWNFFSKVKRKILWCTRWKLSIMWIRHHLQPINFINYIKARKPQKITFGALFAFRTFLSFLNTWIKTDLYNAL